MRYNNSIMSRIIRHSKASKPEFATLEALHKVVKEAAQKDLEVRLSGRLNDDTRPIVDKTVDELTLLLAQKVRPGSTTKAMHQLDWEIGVMVNDKLEVLEAAKVETAKAAGILGQVIRACVDANHDATGIRASVPHAGRLEEIYRAHRLAREFSSPVTTR
jgi:hypothetical protein